MWIFEKDIWREVYTTLTKNIMRTILTTLGVLFAIIILILLLGATNGMKNGFDKLFAGTATNSMVVWSGRTGKPYKGFERGRSISFSFDDIELIKEQVKGIETLSPRVNLNRSNGGAKVTRNGQSSGATVYGDFPEIDDVFKKNLIEGRFINQKDIEDQRKVCVIGNEVYKSLYDKNEEAIGTYVQINGIFFQVIGIYKKKRGVSFDGQNAINIPFSTFQKSYNSGNRVSYMAIAVRSDQTVSKVLKRIKDLLKIKYNIHPKDTRAIGSFNLSDFFKAFDGFTMVLQGFSFFIGIFTLLAGVVAISNILLITVRERTKEIGIRRALGATPKIIKRQIILEAIVLTTISALVGFVVSVWGLYILDEAFKGDKFPFSNPTVSFTQIITSFILMVLLSLLVGLIPANRAIKIKPIEALREE